MRRHHYNFLLYLVLFCLFLFRKCSSQYNIDKNNPAGEEAVVTGAAAHKHRRCGGKNHAAANRPCMHSDTLCGYWKGRFWYPYGCRYEDISPQKAASCLGNRTLAFIGDSMVRDLMIGVSYFLLEVYTLDSAPESKFDGLHDINEWGERIDDFPSWMRNVPPHNYNGNVFPRREVAQSRNISWQVQMWSLYTGQFLENGQIEDVLSNRMVNASRNLRPIDLAFWQLGIHDWGWWDSEPVGEKFYEQMVGRWLRVRERVPVPSVWLSMNPNCVEKLSGSLTAHKKEHQQAMVEKANAHTNAALLREKLPYFDYGAPLRTASRCEHSADGIHTKLYVSVMAAKMLFNHLCDAHGNWRGGTSSFV